jgi:hypothetical protein
MSLRVPVALPVALSLIVLPVIIVRAQAEEETEAPPAPEVIADTAEPATTDIAPTAPEVEPAGEETTADAGIPHH